MDNLLLELAVINLKRMNESVPEEAQGVFNTLTLVENLTEIDPKVSELLAERTDFFEWIMKRLQKPEFDNNKQYASEILAIALQSSKGNRLKVGALDGIDTLLTATSVRSLPQHNKKRKFQLEAHGKCDFLA